MHDEVMFRGMSPGTDARMHVTQLLLSSMDARIPRPDASPSSGGEAAA
jgi:hypothetical protein